MITGVIEGFFGKAWGWPQRHLTATFLAGAGFGFYTYAPKSDASLRRAWREPIPSGTERELAALGEQCRSLGLEFGIGLSPFEVYRDYGSQEREQLRAKVAQIDRIGATQLCVLFDDMRGDIPALAELQARIVSDIAGWTQASRLIFCPTYYSFDPVLERVFGAQPVGYLSDVGRLLDRRIDFFWTGESICSDCYTAPHLERVAQIIGRKPFIWDNHIANDSKLRSRFLFMTPQEGRWRLPADMACGLAINPMNQPSLSRIALCGYAKMLGIESVHASSPDCLAASGPEVSCMLRADLPVLQKTGLDAMSETERVSMRKRYSTQGENAFAREILAWLDGEYRFDPACLTD